MPDSRLKALHRFLHVVGDDAGGQAVVGVVGDFEGLPVVPNLDDRSDGTKALLVEDAHVPGHAAEHRRASCLAPHNNFAREAYTRMRAAYLEMSVRRSRASASISTFISGFNSAETTTIVAAGRIAPKTSPCTVTTASQ
jgi:hypothetical protein